MCVAVPSRITELHEHGMATVSVGDARKRISLLLIEGAKVGDYVIVHAGFAIKKIDEEEARESLRILKQIVESSPEGGFETWGDPTQ